MWQLEILEFCKSTFEVVNINISEESKIEMYYFYSGGILVLILASIYVKVLNRRTNKYIEENNELRNLLIDVYGTKGKIDSRLITKIKKILKK